jgi:hypothetical protein
MKEHITAKLLLAFLVVEGIIEVACPDTNSINDKNFLENAKEGI